MDQKIDNPIEQAVTGQAVYPLVSGEQQINGITYIPAGNHEILSPANLGGSIYDTNKHSTVTPSWQAKAHSHELTGLVIHNPDGSKLAVNLSEYKSHFSQSDTEQLRHNLLRTYQREAETDYGTSTFTQNAQFFKEISWEVLKQNDVLNNPAKLESSYIEGRLSGYFLHKSDVEQSNILYQQHDAMQDAIDRKLISASKAISTEMNTEQNPSTIKELLDAQIPKTQQEDIIKRVLEKMHETHQDQMQDQSLDR
ncbi:MAG: hypothetical protein CVU29_03680 [Betaproteobacteria bacterium HGW-Betaproteobacteria-22]|nr:MAG: hypothetical protein CVU29_03680 [Betaproteobacteria bacterium HGW-Betaproteobacteria-22]